VTDPTKSGISRCPHGCYRPGDFADACSICNPISVGEKEITRTFLVWNREDREWKNIAKK
jgi:hypothetical protein